MPPGPGLWKFNTSILDDIEYFELISSFWANWRRRKICFSSLSDWWEAGKAKIKRLTVSYCVDRAKQSSRVRSLLARLADHLKIRVDEGHLSCLGPYRSVLGELARLDLEKAKGAQVRSRNRWVEEGETSSSYFFRLEKKRSAVSWISALRESDGTIVSSPSDLCHSFAAFYSSLFTASAIDSVARDSLLSNLSSILPPDQAEHCEGRFSVDECHAALFGMAKGKSPGLDGLPMEFYVKFWSIIGSDLVDVLNSCYSSGSLALSQRRGVISLIFKKGDRLDIRNWRPISLLNVDYKIAARALAGRLLKVIHIVVHKDQTCGVPGRFIRENVAYLRDVVDYTTKFNVPAAILFLDQEKAFDRVNWDFRLATLGKMGFGPSFVNWVSLLYTNVQSSVKVNGYLSPFSLCLVVSVKAAPCLPSCMYWWLRCLLQISALTLVLSAFFFPVHPSPFLLFLSTRTTRLSLFVLMQSIKSKGLWLGSWNNRADPPVALD